MLIVFEGIDKSGKSTQYRRLIDSLHNLNSRPCHQFRYPDRSLHPTGILIDDYLAQRIHMNNEAASLLLAANLWEIATKISLLPHDSIVLMDRYRWSNEAYSLARGMCSMKIQKINSRLPQPDLIVWMDLDPVTASKRNLYGSERFDDLAFQRSVYANFKDLITSYPQSNILTIDASLPEDEIANSILTRTLALLT